MITAPRISVPHTTTSACPSFCPASTVVFVSTRGAPGVPGAGGKGRSSMRTWSPRKVSTAARSDASRTSRSRRSFGMMGSTKSRMVSFTTSVSSCRLTLSVVRVPPSMLISGRSGPPCPPPPSTIPNPGSLTLLFPPIFTAGELACCFARISRMTPRISARTATSTRNGSAAPWRLFVEPLPELALELDPRRHDGADAVSLLGRAPRRPRREREQEHDRAPHSPRVEHVDP